MEENNELFLDNMDSYDIPSYEDDEYEYVEVEDYKEENIDFCINKFGPAPLDYLIVAQTSVIQAPQINPVYIIVWYHPQNLEFFVSDFPVIKDGTLLPQEERNIPREFYRKIEDAGKSDYFKFLLHIDKALDKKIEDIKNHELDIKYAPHGLKIGGGWYKTFNLYGEVYNRLQPEHHEYVQVHSRNGKYTYTASHTSYARQYELGDLYKAYFGDPPKQEYFVRTNSLRELDSKHSSFAISFKSLQHKMLNELLEVGMAPYEARGKKLPYDPILTSVRGAPGKTCKGQLVEATIDINSFQRVYIIAVNTDGKENLFVSSRSLYQESMPNMYHAFDFDWPNVILKEFNSRDEAISDAVYGVIYPSLFRLMEGIEKTKKPYIWRKGCMDLYGFADIEFNEGMGSEQDFDSIGSTYPPNFNVMMSPHP